MVTGKSVVQDMCRQERCERYAPKLCAHGDRGQNAGNLSRCGSRVSEQTQNSSACQICIITLCLSVNIESSHVSGVEEYVLNF